ncbi:endoribonuclease Dicer [Blastomyces parvus]|uniref:Dicer-like protein 1 n=1 Tax=Blastomyces parvus TaxID=2060905 RepID=A0A2B7WV05_9EURO|nr:endoribonuclease Dicer [Blastomyces parvus]
MSAMDIDKPVGWHDDASESEGSDNELENSSQAPLSEEGRRQRQNAKFQALLSTRTETLTAEDIQRATKAKHDSELSMNNLIDKQDFSSVIHDPREYQLELFEKAKTANIIAVLDTGSGKTLIAVLLLKHMIQNELTDRANGKPPRISFFLVDSVTLVYQQAAVLKANIDQNIDKFCGAMQTDLWSRDIWDKHFSKNMVIVCTAEVLHQCLLRSFIQMERINLLIFDEAHHAKKDHPYARIVKDFYLQRTELQHRPKIFGMTASPVDAKVDVVKAARTLETLLDSQIATASNLDALRQAIPRPNEQVWVYDRLDDPCETELYKSMQSRFGGIRPLKKIFSFALEASSTLGRWCSDWLWKFALDEAELPNIEGKISKSYLQSRSGDHSKGVDEAIALLQEAGALIKSHPFYTPVDCTEHLSSKVRLLAHELSRYFERHTDTKCIVFVQQRYTARLLAELFSRIGTQHMRTGVLIGVRHDSIGGGHFSFRQQFLTLLKFRKGELNCLFATSVAEEGLDIPDCNLIIRFDLNLTMIQYVQSRGRARHSNSMYAHMVERDNLIHSSCIEDVQRTENIMRRFCEALPEDRIIRGSSDDLGMILDKERYRTSFTVPSTGAMLTYDSSLAVLAHYASSLQYENEMSTQVNYFIQRIDGAFVCEASLPEKSPFRGSTGKPLARKLHAKQSAAFETCLMLRKNGLLDDHFVSKYHKRLPAMRNAKLAINSKKKNQYDMIMKPKLWENSRGTIPNEIYVQLLTLKPTGKLRRKYQPLLLLTRDALPQFPRFPLYLEDDIEADVVSIPLRTALRVSEADLDLLTRFTLRIFQDLFHKVYERQPAMMAYWLCPARLNSGDSDISDNVDPRDLLDVRILQDVQQNSEICWSRGMSPSAVENRFLFDKWDGRYRYFTSTVEPSLSPSDPPQPAMAKRKNMENIMNYCLSLFKRSRLKFLGECDWEQPVVRAELVRLRRNLLDRAMEQEKGEETTYYICPEPLRISALPAPVAAFAFAFPAIISRLESYLISLEACDKLQLNIETYLALEALTKDSDNTEEHRGEQIHFQRGMGKNYERLEFLGDCFLKMATSISLFAMNPDNDEYDFHVKRMCLICNQNLFNTAVSIKLYEFIRTQGFSRRDWYPEGIKLLKGKAKSESQNKHSLGDKTIADICEALIGASLLSGGKAHRFDTAVKAVTAFVNSDNHRVSDWDCYFDLYSLPKYQTAKADAGQLDLARQIGDRLGYQFNYPRLLRSAFTHASFPSWNGVPCYQRLEFLGDSLLDMVCVEYLYHHYPDRDPQWLTEHKMAMVSNKFLGAAAVKLGLHRHLLHSSNALLGQITRYAEEIEVAEAEGNDSPDAWTTISDPPKCLPDMLEAYIGAIFVDSNFKFEVVEDFFQRYLKHYFEDMSIYDTFANKHPTTYFHNRLTIDFGCTYYCLKAGEVQMVDGTEPRVYAAVVIHDEFVAEGIASSVRYAKIKASEAAVAKLEGLAPFKFREIYGCDCVANKGREEGGGTSYSPDDVMPICG